MRVSALRSRYHCTAMGHSKREWARAIQPVWDDDGDGIREVHCNIIEHTGLKEMTAGLLQAMALLTRKAT